MIGLIVTAVQTVLPTVVAVALFLGLGTLVVRSDLVTKTIADYMLWRSKPTVEQQQPPAAAITGGEWTDAAEWLTGVPVPPVVRVQVLVNRVRRFRADRLASLNIRLDRVDKRLSDTIRKGRRARIAYKFAQSQLTAAMTEIDENYTPIVTATVATNTDATVTDKIDANRKPAGKATRPGKRGDGQPNPVENVTGDGPAVRYETVVKELATDLVEATTMLWRAFTSKRWRTPVVAAYRVARYVGSKFEARHFRFVAETVVDVFAKLIAIDVHVYVTAGETNVILKLLPERETV